MNRPDTHLHRLKIIGLGSPNGDDQVGWQVIKHLQSETDAELLQLDRPGPALLHELQNCEQVILVDACDAGWRAGDFRKLTLQQLLHSAVLQQQSSHHLGLAATLQLALTLQYRLPEIDCYLIQLDSVAPLAPLSPAVADAAVTVARQIATQRRSSESG